jgi:hypothetical protein
VLADIHGQYPAWHQADCSDVRWRRWMDPRWFDARRLLARGSRWELYVFVYWYFAGQSCGNGPRSKWPPPPLGGRPALQLYLLAYAACLGRGWRWRKRSAVAPPAAGAALAKGVDLALVYASR